MTHAGSVTNFWEMYKMCFRTDCLEWKGKYLLLSPLHLFKDDPTELIAGLALSCIRGTVE